jgi:hypothetical protein
MGYEVRIFFPEIQRRREISGYSGEAVLIMEGLPCLESSGFEDSSLDNGVFIEVLPAHSSDQLQPYDSIFVTMKTSASRIQQPARLSRQSKQIVKLLDALQGTLLLPTVIHAFAQAGIHAQYSTEHRCLIYVIDSAAARCIR